MTECIKARQWLYRALRTAVQAAAGVVAANLAAWVSGIHDGASIKTVAINAGEADAAIPFSEKTLYWAEGLQNGILSPGGFCITYR